MKRILPIFLVVLLALGGMSFTAPKAAAVYSWTALTNFEIGLTNAPVQYWGAEWGSGIALSDSNFFATFPSSDTVPSDTAQVQRCALTSCSGGTGLNTQTTGRMAKLHSFDSNTAYGCSVGGTGGADTVSFHKTTNAGALWSTNSFASGGGAQTCDVATFDGSHYVVAWANSTTDDWIAAVSLTGGGSGSWIQYPISAASGANLDFEQATVAAWSDTSYTAWVAQDDGLVDECKSTNTGVTWTCTVNRFSAVTLNSERFGDDYYLSFTNYGLGTDNVGIGIATGPNDDLLTTNAVSAAITGNVCGSDIAVFDADRFGASYVVCAGASSQYGYWVETFDGGSTWASELVHTGLSTSLVVGQGSTSMFTGAAYGPTSGRIFTAYGIQYADEVGGADADGDPEKYFTAYLSGEVITTLAATVEVSLTGTFQGGSVDDNGDTVIIRSNSGEVFTYSGQSGVAIASDTTDACNQIDGLFSIGTLVAYLICTAGDPTALRIRTAALTEPTQEDFNGCPPGNDAGECQTEIGLSGDETFGENGGDCLKQLGEVEAFPINFQSQADIDGFNPRHVAWAWSNFDPSGGCAGTAGRVGIDMFTQQGGGLETDDRNVMEQIFAGTTAEEICTGMDGPQFYLGAAGTDANAKAYPASFSIVGGNQELQGTWGSASTFASKYGQTDSIDCAGSKVALRNSGYAAVCSRNATSCVDTPVTDDAVTRAVAISQLLTDNNRYVAYLNGASIYVAFASNMTTICQLTPAAGTHKDLEFVSLGPSVVQFTSSKWARWDLGATCSSESFTIPPEGEEGEDPIPSITPTPSGTLPAQDPTNVLGQLVTSASAAFGFDMAALFGLVILLGITIKASKASGGAVIVVAIAALAAIIICVQLGLFSEWVIYATVFLIILAAGGTIFAATRSGKGGET